MNISFSTDSGMLVVEVSVFHGRAGFVHLRPTSNASSSGHQRFRVEKTPGENAFKIENVVKVLLNDEENSYE